MILLRIAFALLILLTAGITHAQERSAAQPFNTEGDVTNAALLQKVSYLQQMVRMQQEQLRSCGSNNGTLGETLSPNSQENMVATPQAEKEEATTYRAPPSAPTRRPAVGYQVSAAAESRLTCADYSRTYFSRHPAMAAVCKIDLSEPVAPVTEEVTPTVPPIVTSTTNVVSATARPRPVSATTR